MAEEDLDGAFEGAQTVGRGNCSITAPSVPPKTIIAAVGWRIWPRLPPSINSPATMAAIAMRTPMTLLLSIGIYLSVVFIGGGRFRVCW